MVRMATYFMFGKYSLEAVKAISAKRTDDAVALIKQNGGELKAGDQVIVGEVQSAEKPASSARPPMRLF